MFLLTMQHMNLSPQYEWWYLGIANIIVNIYIFNNLTWVCVTKWASPFQLEPLKGQYILPYIAATLERRGRTGLRHVTNKSSRRQIVLFCKKTRFGPKKKKKYIYIYIKILTLRFFIFRLIFISIFILFALYLYIFRC